MRSAKQDLLNYLEFLKQCGYAYAEGAPRLELLNDFLAGGAGRSKTAASPAAKAVSAPCTALPDPPPPASPLSPEERAARVADAMARAAACTRCQLHKGRNNLVYSDGDVLARIMFVGEAPGEEEDRQGVPFVGRSGQLLTKMIEAIGFRREEVYICNTVKCRPPGNRDPLPEEKDACEHFLVEQLAIVRPAMLIALGAHAAQYLCKSDAAIGRLRGVWHSYHGVPLRATYHPAFLLRSPNMKPHAWADFQDIHKKYNELHPQDQRRIWKKEE